ncbi:unnamed protein product [Rhizoctonia solani]|uniref:F-box domain-containing protein n=1 Tax=Rhizoctonia solani TaxID=456999 RepID=A0A8H2W9G0_9AGAM|nr:unnamed protein product [Rhizoctonia solani]
MACLRNHLASSIQRLPDEILSRVFDYAINLYDVEQSHHLSAQYRTQVTYRNLHTLLGVCTAWRRVGISHCALWSLVPVVRNRNDRFMSTAAQLSLERAARSKLHLVAELNRDRLDMETYVREILTQYGPRFSTINLHSDSMAPIRVAVRKLVKSARDTHSSLTGLSICHHRPDKFMARGIDDIYGQSDSDQGDFNRLLEPLQVLRLCGLKIHFGGLLFKNLTELRLQDMWAGRTVDVEDFMWSLSSATQLRRLEVISILNHPNQVNTTPRSYDFPITLRSLETLYLEDLFKDLLDLILGSIAPGSHHTTLHLTGKCVRTYPPRDNEVLGFHDSKLGDFKIDTLMIGHDLGSHGPALRPLLEMLPTVKTLYMDCLTLTPSNLRPLINHAGPGKPTVGFPRLTKLYIGQSFFPDITGLHSLQEVVASHPLTELGLGVGLREFTETRDVLRHIQDPHEQLDSFREWFLNSVPKVVWLPAGDSMKPYATEYESEVWQL